MRARLRERFMAGELTAEDVLTYLRDGDINSFEQAMSLMARLEPAAVRKLTYNQDRRYLAVLCARADFSSPHYITLRMAIELRRGDRQSRRSRAELFRRHDRLPAETVRAPASRRTQDRGNAHGYRPLTRADGHSCRCRSRKHARVRLARGSFDASHQGSAGRSVIDAGVAILPQGLSETP
ncbi:MAG: DUF2336 domain-containing protein [Geminicoccaceae bacterium]